MKNKIIVLNLLMLNASLLLASGAPNDGKDSGKKQEVQNYGPCIMDMLSRPYSFTAAEVSLTASAAAAPSKKPATTASLPTNVTASASISNQAKICKSLS